MKYRVILHRLAREDLEQAHEWVARRAPATATLWLDRFEAAIRTLETYPERQPLARESRKVDIEIRELLFGKSGVFRVIFAVDGDVVRVLRIRRGQRRSLTSQEIEESREVALDPE
jgi:plasmid stabilization system protein ParE